MGTSLIASCLCLTLGVACSLPAQPPDSGERLPFLERHSHAIAQNPEGVTLALKLAVPKSTFQVGEIIPLELAFSSLAPDLYVLEAAQYDRSGRMAYEQFHLEPALGVDPLKDYFAAQRCILGGGLRGVPTLTDQPYLIRLELNEWLRIDAPGRYRLYLTSSRLRKVPGASQPAGSRAPLALASNVVELEIATQDPDWALRQFQQAERALDGAPGAELDQQSALRILRFLGTEQAAKELIRRFRGDQTDFDCKFGLFGSTHRAFVVGELEKRLGDSGQPVSSAYVSTLAILSTCLQKPPLPDFPAGDEARIQAWHEQASKRFEGIDKLRRYSLEALAVAVRRKTGVAKAVSLETLLVDAESLPEELVTGLAAQLVPVFADLDGHKQWWLLRDFWAPLATPALMPVLRRLWEEPPGSHPDMRELALRRMFELSREEATRIIREEIRSARPRAGIGALGLLPDETLPDMEPVIAANLEHAFVNEGLDVTAIHAALLERYGTRASLRAMRTSFGPRVGTLACGLQTSLLAYFLRVDPQLGLETLEHAMRNRSATGCYRDQLSAIWDVRPLPELERAALAHLEDPDAHVRADAVKTLGRCPSPGLEPVLWASFEKLPAETRSVEDQARIEEAFVKALSLSPAWLLDRAKAQKLRAACMTENCRSTARGLLEFWSRPPRIIFDFGSKPGLYFSVVQYRGLRLADLQNKLRQFPPGTVFVWDPHSGGRSAKEMDRSYPEVRDFLAGMGMRLERAPGGSH